MRALRALVFLGMLLLLNATPVLAFTELELFERRLQTFALPPLQLYSKPAKGLCVCINDPSNFRNVGAAGILSVNTFIWPNPGTPPTPPGRAYVTCNVMIGTTRIPATAASPEPSPQFNSAMRLGDRPIASADRSLSATASVERPNWVDRYSSHSPNAEAQPMPSRISRSTVMPTSAHNVTRSVGSQLSTGVVVVLGIRIFSNVASIRRHLFRA